MNAQKLAKWDFLLIFIFIVISMVLILNHEPWRDEAHHWLVARDSPNLYSLIARMGYEGTPGLWDTLLYPFAQLNFPYFTLNIIHFLIALTSIIIFLKYSPFNRVIKTLFIFSYFVIYEYNIIARNYALSVLLLFLIAALFQQRFKTWAYPLLIFLLSNTNIHSLVISLVLFIEYGLTFFINLIQNKKFPKKAFFKIFVIIIVLSGGFLIPIFQLLPGLDSEKQFNLNLNINNLGKISGPVIGAFFPIPKLEPTFWGTKLLYNPSSIATAFGLLVYIISLFILHPYLRSVLIYLFSSLCLFILYLIVSVGGPRHHGFIFIIFIFSVWIAIQNESSNNDYNNRKSNSKCKIFKKINLFLILILIAQILASVITGYYEITYNFSNSKEVSVFLKENNLVNDYTAIATCYSSVSESILPYLDKGYKFYCLYYNRYCSFTPTAENFEKPVSNLFFLKKNLLKFENSKHKNHLLILTDPDLMVLKNYELLASFEGAITNENYYIYELIK